MKLPRGGTAILLAASFVAIAFAATGHAQENMRGAPYNGYTGSAAQEWPGPDLFPSATAWW
jgi:hypothetical protein